MNTLTINRLPSRTWNFLRVNETALSWDEAQTADLGAETLSLSGTPEPVRIPVEGAGAYSRKKIAVEAQPGSRLTVFETFMAEENLAVETELTVRAGATVRLVQVQRTKPGSVLYSKITGTCAESGRIELVQVFPGSGDVYADTLIDLPADGGSFQADIGYLGQRSQTIDMNLVVNHFGRHTECEINIIALDAADNGHEFVLLRLRRFHRQEGSLDRHNAKLQLFHFNSSMILFVNIVVKLCKKKWRTQNRRLFRYVFPSFCRFVRLSTDLIVPPFSAGRLF